MIEDSKREVPRFKGTMHGIKMIVAEEGYRGIYRGLGPVVCLPFSHETMRADRQMLRQGANSAVRFTSYSTLKQLVQGNNTPGSQLPAWLTFGIGASAGVITVCVLIS
jgi:solute carrier family 25 citrate transporter 1